MKNRRLKNLFIAALFVSCAACAGGTAKTPGAATPTPESAGLTTAGGGIVETSVDCKTRWTQVNANLHAFLSTGAANWEAFQNLLPSTKENNRTCTEYGSAIMTITENRQKIWTSLKKDEVRFMNTLAKLQASGDGQLAEWICQDLGLSITKNPERFLQTIEQNRNYITELSCIVNGGNDVVDGPKNQTFSKRRTALMTVKNPQLLSVRTEVLQLLK